MIAAAAPGLAAVRKDAAIFGRAAGEAARTRAIVVYPMNALANSQMKELDKIPRSIRIARSVAAELPILN